jgi:hypothetical protein
MCHFFEVADQDSSHSHGLNQCQFDKIKEKNEYCFEKNYNCFHSILTSHTTLSHP